MMNRQETEQKQGIMYYNIIVGLVSVAVILWTAKVGRKHPHCLNPFSLSSSFELHRASEVWKQP